MCQTSRRWERMIDHCIPTNTVLSSTCVSSSQQKRLPTPQQIIQRARSCQSQALPWTLHEGQFGTCWVSKRKESTRQLKVLSTMPGSGEGMQTQMHTSHHNTLSSDLLVGNTLRSLLSGKRARDGIGTYSCFAVSRKVCTLYALGSELRWCLLFRSNRSQSPLKGIHKWLPVSLWRQTCWKTFWNSSRTLSWHSECRMGLWALPQVQYR